MARKKTAVVSQFAPNRLEAAVRRVTNVWSKFPDDGVHPALKEAALTRSLQRQELADRWPRLATALTELADARAADAAAQPVLAVSLDVEEHQDLVPEITNAITCPGAGWSVKLASFATGGVALGNCPLCGRSVPAYRTEGAWVLRTHAALGASHG